MVPASSSVRSRRRSVLPVVMCRCRPFRGGCRWCVSARPVRSSHLALRSGAEPFGVVGDAAHHAAAQRACGEWSAGGLERCGQEPLASRVGGAAASTAASTASGASGRRTTATMSASLVPSGQLAGDGVPVADGGELLEERVGVAGPVEGAWCRAGVGRRMARTSSW